MTSIFDMPPSGAALLKIAAFSNLFKYIERPEINATVAADPSLSWKDPHPGRLVYCCNQSKVDRLKMFLDTIGVPIKWPARNYWRYGKRCSASNLYEAALNANNEDALLLAIPLYHWNPSFVFYALKYKISQTTWTRAADLLLEKGGPETIARLQCKEDAYSCLMRATPEMMHWFLSHGVDPNNAICAMFGNQPILQHYIEFPNQAKVKLLLAFGARPTQRLIDLAQAKGEEAEEEDPCSSYSDNFYEIKRMLQAAMNK